MNNDSNQPGEFDVVLGGEAPPPTNSVVLGGIEGVKIRLESSEFNVKIAAIEDAIDYGDAGLDLVIEALNNSSLYVKMVATSLLEQSRSPKAKQALINYNPWIIFIKLENWKTKSFNYGIGLLNPMNTAYIIKSKKQLQELTQDSGSKQLKVLKCYIEDRNLYRRKHLQDFFENIADSKNLLPNLKALFIGESKENHLGSSQVYIYNILQILQAYPKLELLQVRGKIDNENFLKSNVAKYQNINRVNEASTKIHFFKHSSLKSLVIEAYELWESSLTKLCNLNLPCLEYFELNVKSGLNIDSLKHLFSGKSFPNLLYLGIINSYDTNNILKFLIESPLIDNLKVLNLSQGSLSTQEDIDLLKSPKINQLYTLNISENCFRAHMIEQLSHLKCQVIGDSQDYYLYDSLCE